MTMPPLLRMALAVPVLLCVLAAAPLAWGEPTRIPTGIVLDDSVRRHAGEIDQALAGLFDSLPELERCATPERDGSCWISFGIDNQDDTLLSVRVHSGGWQVLNRSYPMQVVRRGAKRLDLASALRQAMTDLTAFFPEVIAARQAKAAAARTGRSGEVRAPAPLPPTSGGRKAHATESRTVATASRTVPRPEPAGATERWFIRPDLRLDDQAWTEAGPAQALPPPPAATPWSYRVRVAGEHDSNVLRFGEPSAVPLRRQDLVLKSALDVERRMGAHRIGYSYLNLWFDRNRDLASNVHTLSYGTSVERGALTAWLPASVSYLRQDGASLLSGASLSPYLVLARGTGLPLKAGLGLAYAAYAPDRLQGYDGPALTLTLGTMGDWKALRWALDLDETLTRLDDDALDYSLTTLTLKGARTFPWQERGGNLALRPSLAVGARRDLSPLDGQRRDDTFVSATVRAALTPSRGSRWSFGPEAALLWNRSSLDQLDYTKSSLALFGEVSW